MGAWGELHPFFFGICGINFCQPPYVMCHTCVLQMNQLTSQVSVEAVVESLQMELSTSGLAVIDKLASALKSDLRPRRGRVQPAGTGEGETDRVGRPVAAQLQLKCNSLNVFACTDTGGNIRLSPIFTELQCIDDFDFGAYFLKRLQHFDLFLH